MDSLPNYKTPYLDATVWIAAISGPPHATEDEVKTARDILANVDVQGLKVIASVVLQAEVLKHPGAASAAEADDLIAGYLERSFIEWVELDMVTAKIARRLRREHKLEPADAFHLATAIRGRADILLTTDEKLLKVADKEPVPVLKPYWHGPLQLDLPETMLKEALRSQPKPPALGP